MRKRGFVLSRTIICLNSNNREQLIFLLKEEIYLCLKIEINPNNYMLDLFVKIISFSLYLGRRKDFIAAREREILKFLGQRKKNYRPCFRPTGLRKKMSDRAKEERVNGASRCGRNTRVQIERVSSFPSLPPPATMRNNEGRSLFGFAFLY